MIRSSFSKLWSNARKADVFHFENFSLASLLDLSIATKACNGTNENRPRTPSTVELATVTTAAGLLYSSTYATPRFMPRPSTVRPAINPLVTSRRYSSTYATPRFMLRPSTARTAIDLSIAKRRCSSTCGIHQRMRRPSTVRLAIDPSATRRPWSSTCGTLPFTNRIRRLLQRPLWMSFSALS